MEKSSRLPFSRNQKISLNREFDLILSQGRKAHSELLRIAQLSTSALNEQRRLWKLPFVAGPRIGIRVPKAFGNAPERNRAKRFVREAFRLSQHCLSEQTQIVVGLKALPQSRKISLAVVELQLRKLWRQLEIWTGS